MTDPDVSPGDMFGRDTNDPLDAVLTGDDRASSRDLSIVVEDIWSAYIPDEAPPRSPALAALTDPGRSARPAPSAPEPHGVRASRRRRQLWSAVAAFAATLTGKIVIAGAVSTAALGGLHVTHAVDVPLLPDVGPAPPVHDPHDDPVVGPLDDPEPNTPGRSTATSDNPAASQGGSKPDTPADDERGRSGPPQNRPGDAPADRAPAGGAPGHGPPVSTGPPSDAGPPDGRTGSQPPSTTASSSGKSTPEASESSRPAQNSPGSTRHP